MAGETEEKPSGWTVDTSRADIVARLVEMDRRYEQRFDAQEKAVNAALVSAQQAVAKAEVSSDKRFDEIREKFITTNEFRGQLSDQASTLMPRAEANVILSNLAERVNKLESMSDLHQGRGKGLSDTWGYLVGAVGVVGIVIAIIVAFN